MAAPRVPMRCDGCGQTDDHPKHHYGAQTFHHDCTPAYVLDDMTSESTFRYVENVGYVLVDRVPLPEEEWHDSARQFMKIRDLALKGTRGEKLLAKITAMHEEN